MANRTSLYITLGAIISFWLAVSYRQNNIEKSPPLPPSVILPSTALVLLYGGDRFLAANIEQVRATTAATTTNTQVFRIRAHLEVSRLNPCHEDNYWIGNASLTWGGAEEQGFDLLDNAMHCRVWDEWPAFFYGFNQHFFRHDTDKAREALKVAADRSHDNSAAFTTFSVMLSAGELNNTTAALKLLTKEHDEAIDPKLRDMLNERIIRLNGLLALQEAQATYEQRFGKTLTSPQELLENGILETFPNDPLGLGYDFRDNRFYLRRMQIK